MGNHITREQKGDTDLSINKCPWRNRSLSTLASKDGNIELTPFNMKTIKEDTKTNLVTFRECKEHQVEMKICLEQNTKKRRKRRQKSLSNRKFAENSSETENFEYTKNLGTNKMKQNQKERYKSEQENAELILNILETLANLEATFVEEKKYERRLFTAVEAQIQEIQRFNLLLDKERGQNKKLMALLDCSTGGYEPITSRDDTVLREMQSSERAAFSRNLCSSMSPLLLQQKCDELTANLNHCKAELSSKNKEYFLSQCRLDELQESCKALTQELKDSNERVELLNQEILALKQERKHLKKSLRTFAQAEVFDHRKNIQLSRRSSTHQNKEMEFQRETSNRKCFVTKTKEE